MRRTAPVFLASLILWSSVSAATGAEPRDCEFDANVGDLVCSVDGETSKPGLPSEPKRDTTDPGKRFVYTATDATIGACYYWSNITGGLDAWDPANDPAVIGITTSLPLCPAIIVAPVDAQAAAWAIFRSWDLEVPVPVVTPTERGITGIATQIAVVTPDVITYSEVLPDGRTLEVRARAGMLVVDWGDGTLTSQNPGTATGYPDGSAAHVYQRKTCTKQYRAENPSGSLCHPSAEFYPIVAGFVWSGEYSIGSGWLLLGNLTVSADPNNYDVDEARGITTP